MWTNQARTENAIGFILSVTVVLCILALPCSSREMENGGEVRVSFNRGQDAANIADALDNRVEEEAGEDAESGNVGGEEPHEEPNVPLIPQDDKQGGGDRNNVQVPPPPLHPDAPRSSDTMLPAAKGSNGNEDIQPRLRHIVDSLSDGHDARRDGGYELKGNEAFDPSKSRAPGRQHMPSGEDELGHRSEGLPAVAQPLEPRPVDVINTLRNREEVKRGANPGFNKYRDAMEDHVRELEKYIMQLDSADPNTLSQDAIREGKSLCEDMKFQLDEQKQAFAQLLKEKNLLAKTVQEEETALFALQQKVQHPELKQWIKNRAARFSEHFENPETDAVAYYARRYVQPQVFKAQNRISALEGRLEKTVDIVLPAKYGSVVALILALIVVVVPIFVTLSAIASITKAISTRQHVLICNLCITSFVIALAVCGLVLQTDPLKTLYNASDSGFIFLQFCLVALFMTSIAMLARALYYARDDRDLIVFGSQLIFYALVGYNYHSRVVEPALLGYRLDSNTMMYVVYVVDFVAMTLLTISSALPEEIEDMRLPQHAGASRVRGNGLGLSVRGVGNEIGLRESVSSVVGEGIAAGSASLSRLASGMTSTLDSKRA